MNKWVIPTMMTICIACTISLMTATQHLAKKTNLKVEAQPMTLRHYSTQLQTSK